MTISSRSPLHVTRDGPVLWRPRSTAGVHAYSTGREPLGRGRRCTRVKLPAWLVLLVQWHATRCAWSWSTRATPSTACTDLVSRVDFGSSSSSSSTVATVRYACSVVEQCKRYGLKELMCVWDPLAILSSRRPRASSLLACDWCMRCMGKRQRCAAVHSDGRCSAWSPRCGAYRMQTGRGT